MERMRAFHLGIALGLLVLLLDLLFGHLEVFFEIIFLVGPVQDGQDDHGQNAAPENFETHVKDVTGNGCNRQISQFGQVVPFRAHREIGYAAHHKKLAQVFAHIHQDAQRKNFLSPLSGLIFFRSGLIFLGANRNPT
jgi:hypothetical protein